MKQVLIKKGRAVVADTPAPSLLDRNVLVEVRFSLISTGTEVAGLQRSSKSLLQKIKERPENIRKAMELAKKQGVAKMLDTVRMKEGAEMATGYSCAGEVIATGKAVRDLKIGDLVACAGAGKANHAEYVSIPRNLCVKIPEGCSTADASSVTLGAIAMQGVRRADIRVGETVAVIGLGLIGQLTAQIVKAAGCRVIGIDIDPCRIDLALSQGMTLGLNPMSDNVEARALHFSEGNGVDATIITADSTSDAIVQQAMEITRKKGRVVVVGSVGLALQRHPFYRKEIDLLISCSYGPGRYDEMYEENGIDYPYPYVRWTENRNMQSYLRLIAEKQINFDVMVQGRYLLEQAEEAFRALQNSEKRPLAVLLQYLTDTKPHPPTLMPTVTLKALAQSDRIRVGLIGCGSFAVGMHLPNLRDLETEYSIYALAGRDGAKAQTIGKQYGAVYTTTDFRKIVEDPEIDMVLVSTRHNLHAQMTLQALQAGKAVFLEKPLATTEEDFQALRQELLRPGADHRLAVGFNRRFSPAARRARELIANRVNPAIIVYRVNAGYFPPDSWVHTEEGGGRIIGECCHMLDLFRFLIGFPVKSVDVSSITPATANLGSIDNFAATLQYEDGSLATLVYTSLGAKEAAKESVEVFCDSRILTIDDYKGLLIAGSKEKGWAGGVVADKGHREELRLFASHIKGKSTPLIPFDELVETTELSFLIDRMARGIKDDGF